MAIAGAEAVAELTSATDSTSYAMSAFTPAANAILVVFTAATDCTATGNMSGGGLTWHAQTTINYGISSENTASLYWAFTGSSPSSTAITWSSAFDAATGIVMTAMQWTGADVGNPIRQFASATGVGNSPTVVFSNAVLTANGYGIGFGTNVNPPAGTPPLTWTEIADTGYTPPTSGACTAFRATGETGTSYSYSTAASAGDAWGAITYEINAAFDPALVQQPRIARAVPAVVGRVSRLCTSSLEPTVWTTFDPANTPRVRTNRAQPVYRRESTFTAGKMWETIIAGDRPITAVQTRPLPAGKRSLIAYTPDMSGPALASSTYRPWQPAPFFRGRESKFIYIPEDPIPPKWFGTRSTTERGPTLLRRSFLTNAFPQPELTAGAFITAPIKRILYRGSSISQGMDSVAEGMQAIPLVTVAGRMPVVRPGRTWTTRELEPETIGLAERPAVYGSFRTFRIRQSYWPQTRIAWVPQTISTAVRKDDRDDVGTSTRSQTSTGGSGRNRSSTGVATQG